MKEISSLEGSSAKKTAVKPSLKTSSKAGGKSDLRPLYAFFAALVLYVIAMAVMQQVSFGRLLVPSK